MQIEIVSPKNMALGVVLVIAIAVVVLMSQIQAEAASLILTPVSTPTVTAMTESSPTPHPVLITTPTPHPVLITTPMVPLSDNKNIFACKMPPVNGVVTSKYGEKRENGTRHKGIDYGCIGQDVRVVSPMVGRISYVGDLGKLGNAIIIENNGWRVILGHIAFWRVQVGMEVKVGDVLAICGSTGNSSGPHVHMEVQKWNDPWYWQTVRPENLPGAEQCNWESLQNLPVTPTPRR